MIAGRQAPINSCPACGYKSRSTCRRCGKKRHRQSDNLCNNLAEIQSDAHLSEAENWRRQSGSKRAISFHMAYLDSSLSANENDVYICPLVNDGATYSGIGLVELRLLAKDLVPNWSGSLHPLPYSVKNRTFCHYSNGNHRSSTRRILG